MKKTITLFSSLPTCCMLVTAASFAQGVWTQKASCPGDPREAAVVFSIGSKGYIGTGHSSNAALTKDFWEWDQTSNTWSQKATFTGPVRRWATGFSIGNKGYIGTGDTGGNALNDFWEWDQATNTWLQKANFGGNVRSAACGLSLNGKGYIGLGNDGIDYQDFWTYDPVTDSWSQLANFSGTARCWAAGFTIGSDIFIGTGFSYPQTRHRDFWKYDLFANAWSQKANYGGSARDAAIGFSLNGIGYLGTGYDYVVPFPNDIWTYDPVNNTWDSSGIFPGADRFRAGAFTIGTSNGKAYILAGGFKGWNNLLFNDLWEYDPNGVGISENSTSITSSIFPNPIHDHFTLQLSEIPSSATEFSVFDISGKKLRTQRLTEKETRMERNELNAGVYFYSVSVNGKTTTSGKLVIE